MTKDEKILMQRAEEDFYVEKLKELSRKESEAEKRYEQYKSRDPFPMIESALLNSADIFQYVAKTGMIYPFYVDYLQGASYEVALRGTVIWWDEEEKIQHQKELVKPGDFFELKPNSIAFVTLEPMFRIPDYLALRFNLKIVHVYKGLLLGTGPLVDPGFVGRLSIPLHNLTANTYTFVAGEGIIQVEFTKLSKNDSWLIKKGQYPYMYKRKWIEPKRTIMQYLSRSLAGNNDNVVKCSIPNELSKIKEETETLKNNITVFTEDMEKRVNRVQIVNIATVISIATIVISVVVYACTTIYQLGTVNSIKEERIEQLEKDYEKLYNEYNNTKDNLNHRILELERLLELEKNTE